MHVLLAANGGQCPGRHRAQVCYRHILSPGTSVDNADANYKVFHPGIDVPV